MSTLKTYTYYDTTGKIICSYYGDQLTSMDVIYPHDRLEGEQLADTYYVSNGTFIKRVVQSTLLDKYTIVANGVDEITFSNVPSGIFKATNTTTNEMIVGSINSVDTFATMVQGLYKISIESFPYLDFEATIEAI